MSWHQASPDASCLRPQETIHRLRSPKGCQVWALDSSSMHRPGLNPSVAAIAGRPQSDPGQLHSRHSAIRCNSSASFCVRRPRPARSCLRMNPRPSRPVQSTSERACTAREENQRKPTQRTCPSCVPIWRGANLDEFSVRPWTVACNCRRSEAPRSIERRTWQAVHNGHHRPIESFFLNGPNPQWRKCASGAG